MLDVLAFRSDGSGVSGQEVGPLDATMTSPSSLRSQEASLVTVLVRAASRGGANALQEQDDWPGLQNYSVDI